MSVADIMGMLRRYRRRLTAQQYRTLRGQVLAGDADGAVRGLKRMMDKEGKSDENA